MGRIAIVFIFGELFRRFIFTVFVVYSIRANEIIKKLGSKVILLPEPSFSFFEVLLRIPSLLKMFQIKAVPDSASHYLKSLFIGQLQAGVEIVVKMSNPSRAVNVFQSWKIFPFIEVRFIQIFSPCLCKDGMRARKNSMIVIHFFNQVVCLLLKTQADESFV
jgi:hypothetical protein